MEHINCHRMNKKWNNIRYHQIPDCLRESTPNSYGCYQANKKNVTNRKKKISKLEIDKLFNIQESLQEE